MPICSTGNVISSSAQVGADVILTGNIKNGEIVNADIAAAAAIAATKVQELNVGVNGGVLPSTGIVDAHIAAAAGIVDTKLAQITTASKVSGAALTSLASIPAGAGVIPAANVPGTGWFVGNSSHAGNSSVDETIAHGLGRAPVFVRITTWVYSGTSGLVLQCVGVYNGTNTRSLCLNGNTSAGGVTQRTDYIVYSVYTGGYPCTASITVDATNINLAWDGNANNASTLLYLVEAM